MYDDWEEYNYDDEEIKNPNLFITMEETISNRIWSSNVFPWQETLPWQIP